MRPEGISHTSLVRLESTQCIYYRNEKEGEIQEKIITGCGRMEMRLKTEGTEKRLVKNHGGDQGSQRAAESAIIISNIYEYMLVVSI